MNMKTSANDVSNLEIMEELKKLSFKIDANHVEVLGTVQGLAQHMDEEILKGGVRSQSEHGYKRRFI